MLCEVCKKNNATVFYSENINGKVRKLSLCENCAAEAEKKGELDLNFDSAFKFPKSDWLPFAGNAGSLFSSVFDDMPRLGAASSDEKGKKEPEKCPLCGATFNDIVREGEIGCPKCYETFGDRLSRTVKGIHGSVTHTGRAPKLYAEKRERQAKIDDLNDRLKAAVDAQEFEEAAKLRDEIKSLCAE